MLNEITAKVIEDSRGNPTIEVIVSGNGEIASACVPSGASTGRLELKIVPAQKAVENIKKLISPRLAGKNPVHQISIDNSLIEINNALEVGGNAIVGVSMAVARLGAKIKRQSLYQHLRDVFNPDLEDYKIPQPCFNIINGGAHSQNDLAIQEFMIKPKAKSFSEQLEIGKKVYKKLGTLLPEGTPLGDEGGYAPELSSTREALDLIKKADEDNEVEIILDCAASQFYEIENYLIDGKNLGRNQLLEYYKNLIKEYPIVALEDPFAEHDWKGFQRIFQALEGEVTIIGDDLLVTDPSLIEKAAKETACNGAIIKINQIGTVGQAMRAVKTAKQFHWKTMVSHRSGETEDDFIADFAVAVQSDFIKSGAPGPKERMAKYDRLLEISQ